MIAAFLSNIIMMVAPISRNDSMVSFNLPASHILYFGMLLGLLRLW